MERLLVVFTMSSRCGGIRKAIETAGVKFRHFEWKDAMNGRRNQKSDRFAGSLQFVDATRIRRADGS